MTLRLLFAALLATGLAGCDLFGDDAPEVAGAYRAVQFTVTVEGEGQDLLAEGASLDLVLDGDSEGGTVDGRLVVPDLDGSGAVDEVLDGTYTAQSIVTAQLDMSEGDVLVRFTMDADVFVRDVDWKLRGDRLTGRYPDGVQDDGIVVVLERE